MTGSSADKIHHGFFIVNTDGNRCFSEFNGIAIDRFDLRQRDYVGFMNANELGGR